MWVLGVEILNIREFTIGKIQLDKKMNLLVGQNNAGKSAILKILYFLQDTNVLSNEDVKIGQTSGLATITLSDLSASQKKEYFNATSDATTQIKMVITLNKLPNASRTITYHLNNDTNRFGFGHFNDSEPKNFIYPFLSNRKVAKLSNDIGLNSANAVLPNLQNLVAKIDRIQASRHPKREEFNKACIDILGFEVSTYPFPQGGKNIVFIVNENEYIPIQAMGDGIPHLLGFITSLCMAKDKLFLIEEMENDIHPKALKALLTLIIEITCAEPIGSPLQ